MSNCSTCGDELTSRPSPRRGGMVLLVALFGCDRCDARRAKEKLERESLEALQQANTEKENE